MMKVKDLINLLKKHDSEAEVHISNDRGYYKYLGCPSCVDKEEWLASNSHEGSDEESDDYVYPEPPLCDGSCKIGPVVIEVD